MYNKNLKKCLCDECSPRHDGINRVGNVKNYQHEDYSERISQQRLNPFFHQSRRYVIHICRSGIGLYIYLFLKLNI